jgi:predicted porin
MVGNGNGIARGDNDDNRELYYYLSAGQVFGGKGPRRQDWKVYAWYQDGKRTLFDTTTTAVDPVSGNPVPVPVEREFDRTRWGVGGTYRRDKLRLYGEYIVADGMIANGTDGGAVPGAINNAGTQVATANTLTDNKAKGWYLDAGYKVLPNLELDVRYDELERGTEGNPAIQRDFERWTVGAQYFFNKKSRFTLNYEFREIDAPGAGTGPNTILDSIDDQLTAQVLIIF